MKSPTNLKQLPNFEKENLSIYLNPLSFDLCLCLNKEMLKKKNQLLSLLFEGLFLNHWLLNMLDQLVIVDNSCFQEGVEKSKILLKLLLLLQKEYSRAE